MSLAIRTAASVLAVAAIAASAATAQPLGCPSRFEFETLAEINAERALAGLAPVALEVRLLEAAQLHSDDMADNDFVSHDGSNGSTMVDRVEDAGYSSWLALGEAVAAGYATPGDVVDGWMNSPPHRAILLGAGYEHVGIGWSYLGGTGYGHYWTANFGASFDGGQPPVGACPACGNGADDDGDGAIDAGADPGCRDANATTESPRCDDGLDNDSDGGVDWDGAGAGVPDAQCVGQPWRDREGAGSSCGLGAEVAVALFLVRRLQRRRRAP